MSAGRSSWTPGSNPTSSPWWRSSLTMASACSMQWSQMWPVTPAMRMSTSDFLRPQNEQLISRSAMLESVGLALEDLVDHAVGFGLLGNHPVVAVAVLPHLLVILTTVVGDDLVELFLELHDLPGGDFDVAGLATGPTQRLMDHGPAVLQARPLAGSPGAKQHGAHRGRHARADGRHVGADVLHRVVDAESGVDAATWGIDVDLDVLGRVGGLEEEHLGLNDVGDVVIDPGAEEDDAVGHQAGEDVHLAERHLTLLDYGARHVLRTVDGGDVVLDVVAGEAAVLDGVLQEFLAGAHHENGKLGPTRHRAEGKIQSARTISIHSSWETSFSLILASSRSLSMALRS